MKGKGIILALGAGAIVFGASKLMAKQAAAENLTYDIISLKFQKGQKNPLKLYAMLKMGINNDSNQNLNFDRFKGELYYGTRLASNFDVKSSSGAITLPKQSTTRVDVPIQIQTAQVANILLDLILKKEAVKEIMIKGTLFIGPFQIPVEYKLSE